MKFDDLDREMRRFETERDWQVPEGLFIVARMDGRGFTRLTKEVMRFEAPYDERFRDAIAATARHLMDCGFRALHAYCQSDEISLLLHPRDGTFQRKERKLLSILAGEASAAITHALGLPACMDSRLSLLPDAARVADYFRWRMEDARRNCLNSHAYWLLRRLGRDAVAAHEELGGASVEEKTALLAAHGIVFHELPAWQRRGFAVEWREEEKAGIDPRTGAATVTTRRRLQTLLELPEGADYGAHISRLVSSAVASPNEALDPPATRAEAAAHAAGQLPLAHALPEPVPGTLTILSGGQTGVDRAALDAALALGFPCGGWVPADRRAEDGTIAEHYPVTALAQGGYRRRTIANLQLGDGTVVIHHGELEGGTAETVRLARRFSRPLLLIDAATCTPEQAGAMMAAFVRERRLRTLNIAGPRISKWPGAHAFAFHSITHMSSRLRGQ